MNTTPDNPAASSSQSPNGPDAYAFQVQTPDGQVMSGTLEAADGNQVRNWLTGLGLRLMSLSPLSRQARPKAMRGEDFAAFNQQLAHLTEAGLPVEAGLRLIAQDVRSGRLAATIRQVADELDRGRPLAEAFEAHRAQFPPLYGRLIDAGVRSHNLPAMLLNLGRHVELVHRLRAMLWQVMAYPLSVLVGVVLVMLFLSVFVMPRFAEIYEDFDTSLPAMTVFLMKLGHWAPYLLTGVLVLLAGALVAVALVRQTGWDRVVIDKLVLPIPLIGTIIRRNLVARWCDALGLGVQAGLDLPSALALAGEAVRWSTLEQESRRMVEQLSAGQALSEGPPTRAIPPAVRVAIDQAGRTGDLAESLAALSRMYQEQAELRLNSMPAFLTPLLILLMGLLVGFVVMALFLPLVVVVQSVG